MAGYSATPLVKKLGIKEAHDLYVLNAPDAYFDWLAPLPAGVKVHAKATGQLDFIHLFVADQKTFKKCSPPHARY